MNSATNGGRGRWHRACRAESPVPKCDRNAPVRGHVPVTVLRRDEPSLLLGAISALCGCRRMARAVHADARSCVSPLASRKDANEEGGSSYVSPPGIWGAYFGRSHLRLRYPKRQVTASEAGTPRSALQRRV